VHQAASYYRRRVDALNKSHCAPISPKVRADSNPFILTGGPNSNLDVLSRLVALHHTGFQI
jgi:hypothetical protein